MATIKDVAKEAEVSVGTVSRYLNGAEIKEDNKARIDLAVKKLDFKLNPIARCLKTSKTNSIGVIIPNLNDIFATTIVKNIEQKLYERGYNTFVCDSWGDIKLERQKVELLAQKMVDGLIIYPCTEDVSYLSNILEKRVPVVTIDTAVRDFECDQVLTDNVNATYSAVEWLFSNKHRRIGIINGAKEYFTSGERLKGYERVHEDYSIKVDPELIQAKGYNEKSGYDSLVKLMNMDNPPTAIVTCNYYTTLGAVKAVYELGIQVPEQLSLIGFDNLGLSEIVRPPLSIIVQPMVDIGAKAAELILRRIHGDYDDFPTVARLKTELIIRESTKAL